MKTTRFLSVLMMTLLSGIAIAQTSPFDAARNGDTLTLKEYLDNGGDPNLTDDRGSSLLILAAYYSHPEALELLAKNGANLNSSDRSGNTALMGACFHNDLNIVTLLTTLGADVNQINLNNANALHFAANFSQEAIVRLLFQSGTNIHQPDLMGKTPLDYMRIQDRHELAVELETALTNK